MKFDKLKAALAGAFLLLTLTPAMTAEKGELQTGQGLLCDTVEQVRQVEKNYADTDSYIEIEGCGIMPVAFTHDADVGEVTIKGRPYVIGEITVVGVVTQRGIQPVPPTKQYTIFPIKREQARG